MAESAQRSNVVWLALEGRREWVGGSGRTGRRHGSLPGKRLRGLDQRVGSRGGEQWARSGRTSGVGRRE